VSLDGEHLRWERDVSAPPTPFRLSQPPTPFPCPSVKMGAVGSRLRFEQVAAGSRLRLEQVAAGSRLRLEQVAAGSRLRLEQAAFLQPPAPFFSGAQQRKAEQHPSHPNYSCLNQT